MTSHPGQSPGPGTHHVELHGCIMAHVTLLRCHAGAETHLAILSIHLCTSGQSAFVITKDDFRRHPAVTEEQQGDPEYSTGLHI